MTTTQLMNDIIYEMKVHLSIAQLEILKNVLADKMQGVTFEESTELSNNIENNEYLINLFLSTKMVEGCSDKTIELYEYVIKKFFNETGLSVLRVEANHIRAYLYRKEKENLSKATLNSYIKCLSSFYRWLAEEDYIPKNICASIKAIKEPKKNKNVITSEQVIALRDCCKNDRELALIDLMESTGMRCEELCNLKISDIDFRNGSLIINGKGSKQRTGYLNARAKVSIERYLKNRKYYSEYVFFNKRTKGKLSTDGMHNIMREIRERIGMDNITIHSFRHYFCSELCRKGMNAIYVKELMGHESLDTTNKVYTHINSKTIKSEFDKYCA